jgi:hypothetical protein
MKCKQKAVEVQSRVLQAGKRVRFDVWTWLSDTTAGQTQETTEGRTLPKQSEFTAVCWIKGSRFVEVRWITPTWKKKKNYISPARGG